jgi:hypothetical protein
MQSLITSGLPHKDFQTSIDRIRLKFDSVISEERDDVKGFIHLIEEFFNNKSLSVYKLNSE